jgi:hypothetical protein
MQVQALLIGHRARIAFTARDGKHDAGNSRFANETPLQLHYRVAQVEPQHFACIRQLRWERLYSHQVSILVGGLPDFRYGDNYPLKSSDQDASTRTAKMVSL